MTETSRITLRTTVTDPFVGPIVGIVLLFMTGFGFVFPILPLYARSFGVGNDGAGLLIAAFGFARLFGDLIGGSITDRRGERWTAMVGMTGLAVCATATAFAPSFAVAVLLWGVAGIGSAIVFASFFSYILKAAPRDGVARTLSFFFGAFNVGIVAGGAAGGFIAEAFGLAAPLLAYAMMMILAIPAYLRFVPTLPGATPEPVVVPVAEPAGIEAPRPSAVIVRDLLAVPGFGTALFLNLAYLWVVGAIFNTLVPLFGQQVLGMTPGAIGTTLAVGVAAEFVVLFPAGAIADRRGRKTVMVPSLAALAVAVAALGLAGSAAALTVLIALLALASGFAGVPPAAILSDVVPKDQSGRGVGAFRFCGDIGFFLGPLVAGAASENLGFVTAFVITAAVPAAALVVVLRSRETLRPAAASG